MKKNRLLMCESAYGNGHGSGKGYASKYGSGEGLGFGDGSGYCDASGEGDGDGAGSGMSYECLKTSTMGNGCIDFSGVGIFNMSDDVNIYEIINF